MAHIGEVLRKRRLNLGITDIKKIAAILKIRSIYLTAIESGQFDAIASQVYLIGYLKSYGAFLNVDVSEIINEKRNLNNNSSITELPNTECTDSIPSKSTVIISIVALALLYFTWLYTDYKERNSYIYSEHVASFIEESQTSADSAIIELKSTSDK